MTVKTFDNTVARKVGGVGMVLQLTRADGGTNPAAAKVTVDYSSFRGAGGGGFASRLTLVRLPACVLAQPLTPECAKQRAAQLRVLPVVNDVKTGHLTAEVEVAPAADGTTPGAGNSAGGSGAQATPTTATTASAKASPASPAAATGGTADAFVYAVAASAAATAQGSMAGDFSASPLKPSGTWQAGQAGGAFTYSYPITAPPAPSGDAPQLALQYSSASVDSLTSQTNNQSGIAGMGWDLETGFIERSFVSCSGYAKSGRLGYNTAQVGWPDKCWQSPYSSDPGASKLTLSVDGHSTDIVKDDTGKWRTVEDYGWKIEPMSSQSWWRITTQDGTVYRFGYNEDSSLTMSFIGDDEGEPCHEYYPAPGSGESTVEQVCDDTWRWMLDREVDPNGNVIDYSYTKEDDAYCSPAYDWDLDCAPEYDKAAHVREVDYGHNINVTGSTPTARIVFTTTGRASGNITDVPKWCEDGDYGYCLFNEGPSFYTTQKLSSITTQTLIPGSTDWRNASSWEDVTRWNLSYQWLTGDIWNADKYPILWLDSIQQVGLAGGKGTQIALPPTTFDATFRDNAVSVGLDPVQFPRIGAVNNGLGGRSEVEYGQPHPCPNPWQYPPTDGWDTRGLDCYFVTTNQEIINGTWNYYGEVYAKWLVMSVTDIDLVGGSPEQVTSYSYGGNPAWAVPDNPLAVRQPFRRNDYTEWRGYGQVNTTVGDGLSGSGVSTTSATFFRGMSGQNLTDFDGNSHPDRIELNGRTLQEQARDNNGENSSTRYEYVVTVTGTAPGTRKPSRVDQTREVSREKTTTGWRYTETKTTYNSDGLPVTVNDFGDTGTASDNTCTAITYARNTTNWLIDYEASKEEHAGDDCTTGDLLSRTAYLYDGATDPAANTPTRGNVTETRAYSTPTVYVRSLSTFDNYGRPITTTEPISNTADPEEIKTTTITYDPAIGWPKDGVKVTNPLGHEVKTWSSQYNGQPVGMKDANGKAVNIDYDVLGRTLQLWTPEAPKPDPDDKDHSDNPPAAKVAYTVTSGQPSRTMVSRLQSGAGTSTATYTSTSTYIDGFGRTREVQTASPAGGRIVQVTTYDGRGLTAATSAPVYNAGAPGSGLLNPAWDTVPQWSKPVYDGLGRVTAQVDMTGSREFRRTTTNYLGADKYEVVPPVGGKKVYYTDAADQVTKIEEWLTSGGSSQQTTIAGPTAPASSKTSAAADTAEQAAEAEPPAAGAAPAADTPTVELQAVRSRAAAEAKRSGKAVAVAALTSAVSSTVANPDGSFTTSISTQPARIKQAGKWVEIDTTLVDRDGALVPKVGPMVKVSTGGDGPFATMADEAGNSIALSWPTPLPRPTVKDNVARYADAAGEGADLVVTVLPGGVRHDIELRQRPPGPLNFKVGVKTTGWRLQQDGQGRLRLTDQTGKLVAPVAEPVMLATGSPAVQPGNADKAAAAAARAGKTIDDVKNVKRVGRITSRLTGSGGDLVLELAPDAAFLADPTVTYPVVVDPTLTLSPQADTYITSSGGGSYYSDTSLAVSTGSFFVPTARSYLKFDTSALAGAQITDATLRLYKLSTDVPGFSTANGPIVERITGTWDQTTLTWANKPSVTAVGQAPIPASSIHGGVAEDLTWTVTPIVQAWASGNPNYGVHLRAANEAGDVISLQFHSAEMTGTGAKPPLLTVTYTTASAPAAGNLSITPVSGSAVSSLTPTLHATVSDSAGGNLRADYEIEHDPAYTAEGTGQIWAGSSAGVTSGNDAPVAIPAGKLTDGWHIRWRARATNTGTSVSSAWSAWQTATIVVPDPVVDQLQVTPSQDLSGQTLTPTLTPALAARVTTADATTSRVEFELEHDPADTTHGTGSIWTTGADNVASGAQATVTVPDGKLGDGWKVRWRARAVAAGSNASAWSAWQSLTVKVPAAAVSQLQITPAQTTDGHTVVASLTPQLLATVTDAYGAPLRAEFELEHDPADAQHGTGGIWTGAADNVASGTQATVTVPGGALSNGWGIRWRARAVNTGTQVASAWSDWQTATVNAGNVPSEPGVSALQVTPSQVIDGATVATSLTPQLRAQVTNPAGGTMRAEFELEHDPADTEHGTGQIWTTAVDDVPAGTQASVTVPADKLGEGWMVRWRARAVAGETASAWSDWQTVRVDQPDPVLGTVQVTPSEVVGGKTISSSLTPQLLAQVTDPTGGKVRAEFELEHDPAAPEGQGSGSIWTTAVDDVTSGTQAAVTVPEGKLSDGWLVRWRARAVTSGGTSAWSDWQQLTVTDGSLIPVIGNPRTRPADNGTTTTLTPALLATVSSAQGGQLGAEFEVEHDPADTQHGTGQIWTTSVSGVTSGNDATVTIPAGILSNGWKVRWHARAVKNGIASNWTAWQSVTVSVPNHYDTTYEYDRDGRMTKQVDANGNVRTFTYDLLGRRTAAHDPDAGDSQQAYDAAGRLAWSTDGKGQKVSYSYDALGRATTRWLGEAGTGTKTAEWAYDTAAEGIGRLTSATRYTNGHAYVTGVTGYDSMGRPTGSSITIPAVEGALAGTYTFTADYDTAGNLSQVGMPAKGGLPAEKLTFTFTDLNLPQAVTSDLDGGTTYVATTAYTQTARLASRRYGVNGQITRTLAWDETTGRLTGVITKTKADTSTPATVQDDVFSYNIDDTVNNILDKAAATGGSRGQFECFTYDGLHRLTQAWTTTATSCGTGTAAADGLGIDPYSQSYAWDGVGNLTSLTSNGQTASYTYSPPGATAVRPDAVTSITRPNGTDSYGYDNAGQMTSRTIDGKQSTFTYDELGELTKAVVDGQTTDNVYDADGQRLIRRTPDGKTTLYLGSMELELSAGTVTGKRYYTTADGSQIAIRTPATLTWLLSGNAGSEQLAIDDTTQAARRERYLPFGQRRGDDDLPFTDRGFLGKIEDDSTGLNLLEARFYDPAIAKFLSPDPLLNLANPGLTNAYGYAGGDPVNLSDPDGFEPRPWQASDWKKKSLKERRRILQQYWDGERRAQRESNRRQGENALRNDKKGLGDRASEQIRFRNQVGNTRHHQAVWDEACRKDFVCSNLKEMDATTKSRGAGSLADVVATGGGPGVGSGGFAGMGMVRSLGSNRGGRTVLPPPRLRSRPCSFVPGTKILMADGSLKPIEDVKAGDHLVATDPQTGKTEYHIVLEPLASDGPKSLVKLTTDTDGKRGNATGTVTATDNHPFWVQDVKAWVPAGELKPASWLRTSAGTYVKVVSLQHRVVSRQRVHNLSVEGIHAYYVLAGTVPVLVHNSGLCTEKIDEVFHNPSGRSSQDQFEYHWDKHAKGRGVTREQYLQDAQDWATGIAQPGGKRGLNASLETLADGTRGIKYVDPRTGKGGIIGPGGKAVTFWYGAD
ncbi:hypothetical protein Misp03_59280 [Microbispora sp. NBRC 16548]|nr:hypothetical protein Misp03_59280 [Microbispora sp. NBRC 16548]